MSAEGANTLMIVLTLHSATKSLFIIDQTIFNPNVYLILNIWPLLYDINATDTVFFLNNYMWTRKHANSERGFKLLFWSSDEQLAYFKDDVFSCVYVGLYLIKLIECNQGFL